MNTQESCTILSPINKTEECAKLIIDDLMNVFTLSDIMVVGREYTFSCWVRSDEAGTIIVHGKSFSSTTDWQRFTHTFNASDVDLPIAFSLTGTYYIYHPKLEVGNKATDWTPAPEDVDQDIADANEAIQENTNAIDDALQTIASAQLEIDGLKGSVVTTTADENGNVSALTQVGTGWTFDLSNLELTIGSALDSIATLQEQREETLGAIDSLKLSIEEHDTLKDYVHIGEYEGKPCIELGEIGGDFKLRITNTEMYFMAGSVILTTVTNQKMIAEKIEVKQELQQGGFIWMLHGNGNLGLQWKGVSS